MKRARTDEEEKSIEKKYKTSVQELVDVSDCSICFQDLDGHIYQCSNGHLLCKTCCQKLKPTCPTCKTATLDREFRNLALEKILAARTDLSCKYAKHGCQQLLTGAEKQKHELNCDKRPFVCAHCQVACETQAEKDAHEPACPNQPIPCYIPSCPFKAPNWQGWKDHVANEHHFTVEHMDEKTTITIGFGPGNESKFGSICSEFGAQNTAICFFLLMEPNGDAIISARILNSTSPAHKPVKCMLAVKHMTRERHLLWQQFLIPGFWDSPLFQRNDFALIVPKDMVTYYSTQQENGRKFEVVAQVTFS